LASRIEQSKKITLHRSSEVCAIHGGNLVSSVALRVVDSEARRMIPATHLFVMIGAEPRTELLRQSFALDMNGLSSPAAT
jgi:thioredoxin reductase (NADPH)